MDYYALCDHERTLVKALQLAGASDVVHDLRCNQFPFPQTNYPEELGRALALVDGALAELHCSLASRRTADSHPHIKSAQAQLQRILDRNAERDRLTYERQSAFVAALAAELAKRNAPAEA